MSLKTSVFQKPDQANLPLNIIEAALGAYRPLGSLGWTACFRASTGSGG
jgi:hypothetical protein